MPPGGVEQAGSLEVNNDENGEDLEGYSFHGVMDLSPPVEVDDSPGPVGSGIDTHPLIAAPSVGSLSETGVIEVVSESDEEASLQDGAALLEALNAVAASVPTFEVLRSEVPGERKSSEIPVVEPLVPVIDGNASMLDDVVGDASMLDDIGGNASMLDDYEDPGDVESPLTPADESIADVQQMSLAPPPQLSMQVAATEHAVGALSKASSIAIPVKQPPPPPPPPLPPTQDPGHPYADTSMQQQVTLAPEPQEGYVSSGKKDLDTEVDWSAFLDTLVKQSDEADIPLEIMSDDDGA
jgi:hypothetical protein